MVTTRPEALIGVSSSAKMMEAVLMVRTSLKMPQTLRVTTEVRWRSANSEAVMAKARQPGKRRMARERKIPFSDARVAKARVRAKGPSTGMARRSRVKNMTGARNKIDEKGLEVAGLRRRRIWVSDQRKPEDAAADMTRTKPRASKEVSPATIMITPTVMVVMMAASFQEGFSRRNRKAKRSTKPRTEDLHIAVVAVSIWCWMITTRGRMERPKNTHCKR